LGTTEALHPKQKNKNQRKKKEKEKEKGGTTLPVFLVFLLN
jgi:hypothetical protein